MEQSFKEKKELTVIFTQTGFTVDYEIAAKKKLSEENQNAGLHKAKHMPLKSLTRIRFYLPHIMPNNKSY